MVGGSKHKLTYLLVGLILGFICFVGLFNNRIDQRWQQLPVQLYDPLPVSTLLNNSHLIFAIQKLLEDGSLVLVNRTEYSIYNNKDSNPNDTLVGLEKFEFLRNGSGICPGSSRVDLLIIIHTAIPHFGHRAAWRNYIRRFKNSSAGKQYEVRLAFLVGTTGDERLVASLANETAGNDDIVQGNFVDAYKNMTYKHIMGLKWAGERCSTAKFILKADDDAFASIAQLLVYLRARNQSDAPFVGCWVFSNAPAFREKGNKWYTSKQEYGPDKYDPYCSGPAIVYNIPSALELVEASRKLPFFWIDDVYVTGILTHWTGVKLTDMAGRMTIYGWDKAVDSWIGGNSTKYLPKYIMVFQGDLAGLLRLQNKENWCNEHNCTVS